LDSTISERNIAEIGLDKRSQQIFDQILENPEGLVLVTGPTGSGKTTTLYASLGQMNSGTKKIVTAEDPIEYFLPKINQKQVSSHMPMSELLKGLLRQDPDVILVGEIRDADTGTTALNAAMTGHMVLSTVHTSDSIGAITRLRGVGLDDSDIAAALLAVIGQRLVRRNCEKCLAQVETSDEQNALFGGLLQDIRSGQSNGCMECMHTGYKGRQGIFEFLVVDGGLQDLIARGAHGHEMRRYARQKIGMITMVEDAISKVHRGFTTLDELTRVLPFRQIRQARDEKI
jgi:type II secretory ATPase GspE/PulE/Tfp pilus assembly ATPase PilB-like protein